MAVPKQKVSKAKTRSRRSANRVTEMPEFGPCSQCKEPKRPHFACTKCGFYKKTKTGEVITVDVKEKKDKK